MEYTIILGGPTASEQQARNALASERFDVHAEGHDYGLPPSTDAQAESFVSVTGDDVDKAAACVSRLGWRLRLHHETPEPTPLSEAEMLRADLAEMRAEIDALKRAKV